MPAQYIPSTPLRPQEYVSLHAPDEPEQAQTFCFPFCPAEESNPKPDQLMKIAKALGISINVFMDFDIEAVSDVLSLLLKMDKQLDMNFETEKDEGGSFIPSTIKISFKNPLLNHKLGNT